METQIERIELRKDKEAEILYNEQISKDKWCSLWEFKRDNKGRIDECKHILLNKEEVEKIARAMGLIK